jgi:hypothetical protein
MKGQKVYTLSPQIRFAAFHDGGVIFNLDTRESHCLNPTATKVVAQFDGQRSIGTIIDTLAMETNITKAAIKTDVDSFLEDIMSRGWIDDK